MKKLFSVYGSLLLATCAGLMIGLYYDIKDSYLFMLVIALPSMFSAKIMMCYSFMQGQAFFALSGKGADRWENLPYYTRLCIKVFKMRFKCVLILSLFPLLCLVGMYVAFISAADEYLSHDVVRNFRAFYLAFFSGVVVAFLHWAFRWEDYFYGSEYDARVELKSKGYSEELIDQKIMKLRKMGVFGPDSAACQN